MAPEPTASGDSLYLVFAANDHKAVGRSWIAASLLFFVGLAIVAVLTGIERMSLGEINVFAAESGYVQGWTLVRTGFMFMVAIPLFVGIGTAVVPLQVGSPSIAFPRLAAAAFWTWLIAAGVHIASFLADGGLGPANGTRADGTLLTVISLGFMVGALLAASMCIATTVIALRPAGMTLLRVPVFSWSMLITTSVWLFSLPVLLANLIFAFVDLQGRQPIFFGDPDRLWTDVQWAWQQPQIYSLLIPVLGVLVEIVPVASRVRMASRPVVLGLIGLFAVLSFGAWAQHPFSRGADPAFDDGNLLYDEFLYIAFGLVAVLPLLGILGAVVLTVRRGKLPKLGAGLVGAVVGMVLSLAAVVVGTVRVIPLWDALHEDDVILSSATAQLMLVVAAVVASAIGALVYWSPKIFGGYMREPFAMMAIVSVLVGGFTIGVANLVSAFMGQADIGIRAVDSGVETMNVMAGIGVMMLVAAAVAIAAAVLPALASKEQLPDDPWDGHTLEWATPSPPPVGNFVDEIATVGSEAPLLDEFEEVS